MACVRVAVRVRPLNKRERDLSSKVIIHMDGNKTSIFSVKDILMNTSEEKTKSFTYDFSYDSSDAKKPNFATQDKVFTDLGHDVLDAAFEGYNACIFAYGQTGSGKSYTMMGTADDVGLIPRICEGLFSQIAELSQTEHTSFHTSVSYLEIYNERVRDLLGRKPSEGSCLRVREHPRDGPYVEGLSMQQVQSFSDVERLMEKGNDSRTTASTAMNETSSRSHAIFTINFRQARFDAELPSETTSKIHLVDLAGSERADATRATGVRLKEGANINKSLVALGNVISALADASVSGGLKTKKKSAFIPYRDSVLTWLLKDSLGGNSKTIMIATISPAHLNYSETLSTLRYANRVKNIVNKPMVNEDGNVKIIRELREEIAHLKALLSQGTRVSPVGPRLEASVEEKLHRNEARVQQLTQEWTNKWKETQSILREETVALRKEGSGVVLDSELPHLIGIDEDLLSTGVILYRLQEGKTSVGRADAATKQDIVLDSAGVMKEHCVFENRDGAVTLTPLPGAACSVSGAEVTGPCQLTQGAVVLLGTCTTFRFNHPKEAAALRLKRQSGLLSIKELCGSSEMLSKAMLHNSRGDLRVLKSGENVESKCSCEDQTTKMWTSEEVEGLVPQEQWKEDKRDHSLPIMPQEGSSPQHLQLETTAGQLASGQHRGQPALTGGASGARLNGDVPEDISFKLRILESGEAVESDHSLDAPAAQAWTLKEVEDHVAEEKTKEKDGEVEEGHSLPSMLLEEGSLAQQQEGSTARQLSQHGGLNGHNVLEDISIQLRGDPLGGGEIVESEHQKELLTTQTWTSEEVEDHVPEGQRKKKEEEEENHSLPIMLLGEGSPEEWQDVMSAGQLTRGQPKGQPAWSEGSNAGLSGDVQPEEISSQPSCAPNRLPEEEVEMEVEVEAQISSPTSSAQACELVLSDASDVPSSFPLPWDREDELQRGGGGRGRSTSEPQTSLSSNTPVGNLGPAAIHPPWEEASQASSSSSSSSPSASPSSSTCSSLEQHKQQGSTPHPSVPRAQVSEAMSAEAVEPVPGGEWQRQPVGLESRADESGPGTAGPEGAPNKHMGPPSDVRRVPLSLSGSSGGTLLVGELLSSLAEHSETRGGGEACSLLPANTLPPPPPPPSVFAEALGGQRQEPADRLAVEVQFNRGVISALSVETSQIQAEQKAAQSQADDSSASPNPVPNCNSNSSSNSGSSAPPPSGNGMVSWMSEMLKDAGRHLPSPATQLLQQTPSLGGLYAQVCSLVKEVPFLQQLRLELTLSPGATAVEARDLGLLQAPTRIKELLSPQKMATSSLPRELGAFKELLPTLPEQRQMRLYDDQDQQRGGMVRDKSPPWHSGETLSSKPPSPSGLAQIDLAAQQESVSGASADADTAQMLSCATSPSSEAAASVQVWTQRLVDYPPHMLKLQSLPVPSLLSCLLTVLPDEALPSQRPLVVCWLSAASCAQPEPRPALAFLLESALYTLALGNESCQAPSSSILQPPQRMGVFHHLPLVQVREIHVGFAGQSVRLTGSTATSVVTLYTHCPTLTQDLCRWLLSALGARGKPAVDDDWGIHPLLAGDLRRHTLDWAAPSVPDLLLCAGLRVSSRFQKSLAQLVCLLHGNMEGSQRPVLAQVQVLLYASVRRSFKTSTKSDSSALRANNSEPSEEEREGGGATQVVLQFFLTDTHLGLLQEDAVFYPPPRSLPLVPSCPQFRLQQMRPREDVRCVVVKDATRLEVVLVPHTSSTMTSTVVGDGGRRGQSRPCHHANGIAVRADHHQHSHCPSHRPEVWKLTFASTSEASSLINYLSNV